MPQNNPPNRDALVIGIGKYTELTPHKLPELVKDAEKIAQLLETQGGFRVQRVPVTKSDDKEFIDPEQMLVADELKPVIEEKLMNSSSTTVLLFFAGHGLRQEISENHYEGFLATSEASPDEDEWGVSLQWLRELLDKSPIVQQIVWIDACHSGEFIECMNKSTVKNRDRCLITSARAHEEAYADGLLTTALLETLDYTKQLNPWVDHLTLIELLEAKNQTAVGSQRFVFEKTNKPIVLTNKAFDLNVDYKEVCPFKGLESFDFEKNPDDPLYFKGRTQLTHELLEKVKNANFLAVLGASGNGKSSVVRAGLLYQLRQTQRWQILPVITPTLEPLKALGTVIGMPAAQLTDFINQAQTERLVLVIDQFEEVFTLCKNEDEREQFFATLLAAVARADNKFCLVVVMRADFLDKCSQYNELAKKIEKNQIIVTPMTPAELEEAIVAPTQQVGLQIEPKLVSEMLADVKGALGSLPLLQYTLTELWKKCATHRLLTFSAYEKLGKIAGTLEKGANGVYAQLSPAEQKTAQRIFIELTQLGEGTPDTRRQLSQQDLVTTLPFESAPVNQVIQKLVAANLLVTDKPKKEQIAIVNVAHEALTQHWGQLRGWLDGNRDAIKIQRDIEANAKKWQDSNQSKNALLQGLDLNIAKDYAKTHTEKVPLSVRAQDFVKRSVKRQRQYWQTVIGSVVGVILVLAGIAYYANEQRIEADEQAKIAQEQQQLADEQRIVAEKQTQFANEQQQLADERRIEAENQRKFAQTQQKLAENESQRAKQERNNALRGQSLFLADLAQQETEKGNAVNGILLALKALPEDMSNPDRPYIAEAEVSLYDAVIKQYKHTILSGHEKRLTHATFSPNGQLIATASDDGTARLWDVNTGKSLALLRGHKSGIRHVTFHPDGQKVLTSSDDKTARLWDIKTGEQIIILEGHTEDVLRATFSPNGQFILTLSFYGNDGTARLWNASTGEQLAIFGSKSYEDQINDITFTPNGQRIITASDNAIRLWDVKTIKQIMTFSTEEGGEKIAFSSNGQLVASSSFDTIYLWDANTGKQLGILASDLDTVAHIAFSPNEKTFITNAFTAGTGIPTENEIRLWDINTQETFAMLEGHEQGISHVSFNHDGQYVITASFDNTARLWDANTGKPIRVLRGHTDEVYYAEFSPNGQRIVTVEDNTAILWNTTATPFTILGKNDTLSHDGQHIATILNENTVRVWDFSTGKTLSVLKGNDDDILSVTFINERYIVTNSKDKKISYLWNANTGKQLAMGENLSSFVFSSTGQRLLTILGNSTESEQKIYLWDTNTDQKIALLEKLPKTPNKLVSSFHPAFSSEGQYVITPHENTARIWDTQTGKQLTILKINQDKDTVIKKALFSPNGQHIITVSSDNTAYLWDTQTGSQLLIFRETEEAIFSPDGQRIITMFITMLYNEYELYARFLWNTKTGKQLVMFQDCVTEPTFSPNGQFILTKCMKDSTYAFSLWEAKSGKQLFTTLMDNMFVKGAFSDVGSFSTSFTPNGERIISDGSAQNPPSLWDVKTGNLVAEINAGLASYNVFSPNGQRIATAGGWDHTGHDNAVRLWDAKTGKQVAILNYGDYGDDEATYRDVTFSSDGKNIVISNESTTQIWPVFQTTQALIDYAREIVPRQLTPEQRKQFFLPKSQKQIAAATLVDEGKKLAQQGNIESAISKFKKALKLDPGLNLEPEKLLETVKTPSGKTISYFYIPYGIQEYYELIVLILLSESMDDEERQDWFNRTEIMSEEQIEKLKDILRRERINLLEIDAKYKDK